MIEEKVHGDWRKAKKINVKAGRVFTTSLRARGKGTYRARVGAETSLAWPLGK